MIHHFLLTRFNLVLWKHDKNGEEIDRTKWLEERLDLFETYCLPSVVGQTCREFEWILLVDANTPDIYRERIKAYRQQCPQMKFVSVKSQYGFEFASIFSDVVNDELRKREATAGDICLTTYLDNDDCLNKRYVEKVRECVQKTDNSTRFFVFDYGLQYYTELGMLTRISYSNNHFMTLSEPISSNLASLNSIKTCYGYGSHFLLEKNHLASVHHIITKEEPMWIEVIHKDNVDNDVKMTWNTAIVKKDKNYLHGIFSIDVPVSYSSRFVFFLRVFKQMLRRGKDKIVPRKW